MPRVTGIFDDAEHAASAVGDLRDLGVSEDHIGVLSHESEIDTGSEDEAKATGRGAAAGAGVGALFGIAAAAIPAVGPFVTAGVLTSWMGATAGTVVGGAAIGAGSGALAGALQEHADFSEDTAEEYAEKVEKGGVLVVVDAEDDSFDTEAIQSTLKRNEASVEQMN